MEAQRPKLWWTDPLITLPAIAMPVALVTYLLPDSLFLAQWRSPKYFDGKYLAYYSACIAAFCAMCGGARLLAWHSSPAVTQRDWRDDIPWPAVMKIFDWTAVLCIIAYAAWGMSAFSRGASPAEVLAVFSGSKGAADRMKEIYMVTIPGVTTMTQFGIVTMALGCLGATRYPIRRVAPKMAIVMSLAMLRAVLNSERLALIELAIPTTVLGLHVLAPRLERFWWFSPRILAAAPLAGVFAVFSLFASLEYFRSWVSYFAGKGESFLAFATARFAGYYVTSLNNGAFLNERLGPLDAPFFSIPVLWKFPVLKQLTADAFPNFIMLRGTVNLDLLARGGNPEFNNGCGVLLPVVDVGLAGAMLFWAAMGLVAGASYTSFQRMRLSGLLIYPIFFIGIVEAPRIIYATEGRLFPAWSAVTVLLVVSKVLDWRYGRSFETGAAWKSI